MDSLRKQKVKHEGIRYVCGQCKYQATRPMQFVHDKTALANRRLRKEEQAATLTTYHSRLSVQIIYDKPHQGVICHLDFPGGSNQGALTGQVLLIPRTMLTAK